MESLLSELIRRFDGSPVLGYLNFSDGRADPRFRKSLLDVFTFLTESGQRQPWEIVRQWLLTRAGQLEQSGSAAFRDLTQARSVIERAFREVPKEYRRHHHDLLNHQPDAFLFNGFFLARCCEAVLSEGSHVDAVEGAVARLNDFVGYRPIAVLETRPQTDFYSHEKVCPVPLYIRGVGVATSAYAEMIRSALELLEKTDPAQLHEASFDPTKLEELAIDPRAIDHFHPVNKRPSVLFGEWDPHRIDNRGNFRRFVLRQTTLDALVRWIYPKPDSKSPNPERLFEAAAGLCGTILMGAGVSGSGPNFHDSTVTLTSLVQRIARYRDQFYTRLLQQVPGAHGERLREEATRLKQPFAGVRQFLNQSIASERALHLQERRLALLFAAMGYPSAARDRAKNIPAPATRFATEIRLRQTEVGFATKAGKLADSARLLLESEDLLRRGIECGALVDPWNILGYQGLFPIFPGRDDTVRDPRAEDLILTVGRQFDLYAQALSAAAADVEGAFVAKFRSGMRELSNWWDQFATDAVSDLPHVRGGERSEAAEHVARATTLWKSGGANDPAFWRKHRDGFKTPAAFAQVIDALLSHDDHRAAMALLVTWLSEADSVPLQDPSASFFRLAFRWFRAVLGEPGDGEIRERSELIRRFFELLEANSEDRWTVPEIGTEPRRARTTHLDDFEEDEDDDESSEDTYASAYEGVTYEDTTDDGVEGSVAEGGGGPAPGEFALDGEAERAEDRLRFLAAVARLWRTACRPDLWPKTNSAALGAVSEWLRKARRNLTELRELSDRLQSIEIPTPTSGVEGVMEFDRRRAVKNHLVELTVQTAVETASAARSLAALLARPTELAGAAPTESSQASSADSLAWETVAIRLERAVASGNAAAARRILPAFVELFQHEPLLVSPPSDGGAPSQAIRAQVALQMTESLLARLPRIGLLRETYQLTKLARRMERNSPPEGRRVSSFDQLFRTAVTGVVNALLSSAREWGEDASEDSPLASGLRQIADSFQSLWVDHSVGLRLSALESVLDRDDWESLRDFIKTYGGDIFTVRFLTLSNIRGIIAQGTSAWLDREAEQGSQENQPKLVADWAENQIEDRRQTARSFEIVLQSLIEHYDEYRDYNTTTTQSDYGENLYILLDFLRLKVTYDRYNWRLRPMVLAHEVLCRNGFDRLASKWREFLAGRTEKLANELLEELGKRETEHALRLRTVRDRLEERFVQSLRIDQAGARVARAAAAARDGQPEDNASFTGLLTAIQPLADHPSGVGLDVPIWLRRLEEELRKVRNTEDDEESDPAELFPFPTSVAVDFVELKRQLHEWEKPILTDR